MKKNPQKNKTTTTADKYKNRNAPAALTLTSRGSPLSATLIPEREKKRGREKCEKYLQETKKEREIDSSTAAVQQHAHLKIYIGWREIRDGHCFSSSSMAFFSRFFSIFFFFFFFIPFHSLNRFFSSSLSKYQK